MAVLICGCDFKYDKVLRYIICNIWVRQAGKKKSEHLCKVEAISEKVKSNSIQHFSHFEVIKIIIIIIIIYFTETF